MHLLDFIRSFVFSVYNCCFAYSQIDSGIFVCTIVPAGLKRLKQRGVKLTHFVSSAEEFPREKKNGHQFLKRLEGVKEAKNQNKYLH